VAALTAPTGFRNDGIMPLFCPTRQEKFRIKRKMLFLLAPATVHGVVFEIFVRDAPLSHSRAEKFPLHSLRELKD
jgi:hypothetical protein